MGATARQLQCLALLEAQGYAISGAAALVGNFSVESGPNLPSAFRTGRLDHGSQALPQWRLGRLTAYQDYVKGKHPELAEDGMSGAEIEAAYWPWYGRLTHQVEFVAIELKKDYHALDAQLRKGGDVATLATAVCWQYERPNKALSHIAERISYAKAVAAAAPKIAAKTSSIDMPAALSAAQDEHAKIRNGGITTAGAAAIGGAALIGSHVAGYLAWWEWGLLAALTGVIVLGVLGAIKAGTDAANIKAATTGLAAAPALAVKPTPPPAPLPAAAQLIVHSDATKPAALPTPGPTGPASLVARVSALAPQPAAPAPKPTVSVQTPTA